MSEKNFAGTHDLATIMRENQGILVGDAEKYIKAVFMAITNALENEEYDGVHIKGYVKITKKHVSARQGKNPKTGEIIDIEPHNTLSFKMGSNLKAAIR